MRTPTEALRDPRPGDVVRGLIGDTLLCGKSLTCRALVDGCLAYTEGGSTEVKWMIIDWWGKPNHIYDLYEVLYVAQEGGAQ